MNAVLEVSPGLFIWTFISFVAFAILISRFAWKPIVSALSERETKIQDSIERAERASAEAEKMMKDNEAKMAKAQQEMMQLVRDGKAQAQAQIQQALEEAETIKQTKLREARQEIEREREAALRSLQAEVSNLVILATEKVLSKKLDANEQRTLVDNFLKEMHSN